MLKLTADSAELPTGPVGLVTTIPGLENYSENQAKVRLPCCIAFFLAQHTHTVHLFPAQYIYSFSRHNSTHIHCCKLSVLDTISLRVTGFSYLVYLCFSLLSYYSDIYPVYVLLLHFSLNSFCKISAKFQQNGFLSSFYSNSNSDNYAFQNFIDIVLFFLAMLYTVVY
jgi:hypothetical protein